MKFLVALALTFLYFALLLVVYVVHAWYFAVGVVLYSAVIDALIAGALMALLLISVPRLRRALGGLERMLLIAVWLLGGYAFALSGPTVLDRSLSFYILEKLQQRGGGIEQAHLGDVFVNEYMSEYRLVDVRLTEQLQSGYHRNQQWLRNTHAARPPHRQHQQLHPSKFPASQAPADGTIYRRARSPIHQQSPRQTGLRMPVGSVAACRR